MVEMELIELLRQLEMMIEEAPAKAFSHKIVVDREEILSLIKEIKSGKVELIELVKLYSYFSYFSSKKLIPYESETIKKIFEDSMDLVAQKSEYYEIKKDEFTEFALVQNQKDMQKILNKFYEIKGRVK